MSQLTGPQQIQNSATAEKAPELKAVKSGVSSATINVAQDLTATIKVKQPAIALTQQLTLSQVSALQSKQLLTVQQQNLMQIFAANQLAQHALTVSPQLLTVLQQWLKQSPNLDKTLPKELSQLLNEKLGLKPYQLDQILSLSLKQQQLSLSYLQGEAVVEIKFETGQIKTPLEQLQQVLHLFVPVTLLDDSSMLLTQQNSLNEDEEGISFELNFNLEHLGQLQIKVQLNEFELTTKCICSNQNLLAKINQYWPLLEERLSSCGFKVENQIIMQSRLSGDSNNHKPSGLINIKV